jgi:methionyl aminopeptidase
LVSVDGGVNLKGFISDSAYTFGVGEVSKEAQLLLDVTKVALYKGVDQAVAGKRVGDISSAVQDYVTPYKFGIVRELVGHGVGLHLHEKPEVPNYGKRGSGPKLEQGMVICIEPMINAGKAGVKFWDDGWTVSTIDGKLSAHFEQMVSIQKGKPDVLLDFDEIEKVLNKS